jgi:hypothetical protein
MQDQLIFIHILEQTESSPEEADLQVLLALRERMRLTNHNYHLSAVLKHYQDTAWSQIYRNPTDNSMLASISLHMAGFQTLLVQFERFYEIRSGPRLPGRPARTPTKHAVLAMMLTFYCDTISQKRLVELFGMPRSTQSRVMRKAEIALFRALQHIPDAQVNWPTLQQQQLWSAAVTRREPLIIKKWGFIDGKNFKVQRPGSHDLQNACFNGWLHSTLVTGVVLLLKIGTLCFGADGTLVWGSHNNPGSWNDGETSRQFLERLLDLNYCPDQTMGVLSDSAFTVSKSYYGRIETPMKDGDLERLPPNMRNGALRKSNAICAIRQAAEWGMGAAEKPYQRLKMPLPFNPKLRALHLKSIHRL